jgi:ABC-type branched-subunit amino acid transport system substrate-binding protein
MTRPTPLWRTAAVVGVAGLVLAACGGGDDDEGTTPAAEPTTSSSPTESESPATGGTGATGDGALVLGTLLPQTGSLAFLGPPEFAGVDLAVEEINAAGGVLGKPMEVFHSDSGDTTTDIATGSVNRLVSNKVDAIIGAASSGVSFTVIDKIVGEGVVQFSPANTSPDFTTYNDKGLYFRTAPSDVLQGRVMGDLVLADGHANVAILALQDAYGTGLADNVEKAVTDGGGTVVEKIIYDPKAPNYAAEVGQVKAAGADALVLIGFDESKKVIPELVSQGIGPQDLPLYLVDGNLADYSADFPEGTLAGTKGTLPGAETGDEFKTRLLEVDSSLKDFSYAPESYDAAILIALAAEAAGDDSGESIASELVNVSKGGTKCTAFAECKELLAAGDDIDYDGMSGPVEFSDAGDPTEATIGIYEYGADNTYTNVDYRSGKI